MGVPEGATDASLTPYHVARSKLFVRERFSDAIIDLDIPLIERTSSIRVFRCPKTRLINQQATFRDWCGPPI